MSGRRWIFILLAAVSVSTTGCQVDGGATRMWNPFASADKTDGMDDGPLPKFVRRAKDDEKENEEKKTIEIPIDEGRINALLARGQRALQENRMVEARQAYHDVLQLIPDDPTAHHGLAMVADLTEQWAEADNHYRQALRSRPRDANLLCDIGYSYLLQNRYSEASSYLSQAIQINPNHENAHTNLALLDIRQGNREAARERLLQRYGNAATVTQILTALETQTGSKAATGLAATAPSIPEKASFEEIRELANRERIAAEQRRAALNIPIDHHAGADHVSTASHTNVPGQYETASLYDTGAAIPSDVPPQFGGTFGTASHATPLVGNQNKNPASAINGAMAGSWNQNSMPPQNPTLSQYPNGNLQYPTNPGQANFNRQLPVSVNDTAPQTSNTASGSGGLIPVRPSGAFQPPVQGVSYGQPFGFGERPVESASYNVSGNAVAPVGTTLYGNATYSHMISQSAGNTPGQQYPNAGQQYPNPGQNNAHVQIEGLNAGPGSLFPVGQGAGHQDGTLRMENVSPPGSNAVINGAMFGQPVSTLPAQEWMMQQQQKIQQLNSQPQQPGQNTQGFTDPGDNTSQYSGNNPTSSQFGMPNGNTGTSGITIAPRPGNPAQPVNPLASYENQLRQLDNQYNNTLQQLDRNASATVPRAQY